MSKLCLVISAQWPVVLETVEEHGLSCRKSNINIILAETYWVDAEDQDLWFVVLSLIKSGIITYTECDRYRMLTVAWKAISSIRRWVRKGAALYLPLSRKR